jgi:hypothetical protein
MLKIRIHNTETNEIIDRDMTNQEILEHNNTLQEAENLRIKLAQEQANKQSAMNKLKALGLTEAEVKALIGI